MRPLTVLVPALAVALLTACGSTDDEPSPGAEPSPATSSGAAPTSPSPTPDPGEVEGGPGAGADLPPDLRQQPTVARAIADAARRQNVPEARVQVAAWTPVTWNDGSMGCPQPGRAYTQALVDGWFLLLRVDMTLLAYHAGPDGTYAFCAQPEGSYTVRDA